jgi:phosphohistidine phosphatase
MRICVLRHGAALPVAPGGTDRDRALSAAGKEHLRQVLEKTRAAGVRPARILSSPYRRALETAEMAAQILGRGAAIEPTSALQPEAQPALIWDEVRFVPDSPEVLLVGHLPLLEHLAAFLLGHSGRQIEIRAGTMLAIRVPALVAHPAGELEWIQS